MYRFSSSHRQVSLHVRSAPADFFHAALDEIAAELDHLVGFERLMQTSALMGR